MHDFRNANARRASHVAGCPIDPSRRYYQLRKLEHLDDHLLADIGLTRNALTAAISDEKRARKPLRSIFRSIFGGAV